MQGADEEASKVLGYHDVNGVRVFREAVENAAQWCCVIEGERRTQTVT